MIGLRMPTLLCSRRQMLIQPLLDRDSIVFSRWSVGSGPLEGWVVEGWLPKSVFSLGHGLSSVEAWFSTALDIEEVLSGVGGDQLHVMVADVIESFDTVDILLIIFRSVSGSSLLLRCEPWCCDGGVPQGCPLSMVFIVACCEPPTSC